MSEILQKTYEVYEEKLRQLNEEVAETKKILNRLAKDMGVKEIPYQDVAVEGVSASAKIRPDQFYNKPLATAFREYLEMHKKAVEWGEIVKALRDGGFDLPKTKQNEDEARLTVLRNTANFVLIGDNYFGLKSWYPVSKKERDKTSEGNGKGLAALTLKPKLGRPKKNLNEVETKRDAEDFAIERMREKAVEDKEK